MSNAEKIGFIRNYITEIVKGHMVGDIKRLLNIKVIPGTSHGNCNFPIVLYVFSCMDFLGYLVAIEEYSLYGRDTEKRVMAYIDQMFSYEAKKEIEPHRKWFVDTFRHGLSHEFFPKMAGVSRTNAKLMTLRPDGYWVLDADILARMFIQSTDNLVKKTEDEIFCIDIYERNNNILTANTRNEDSLQSKQKFPHKLGTTIPEYGYGGGATGPTYKP
jgi:hypothetical protein